MRKFIFTVVVIGTAAVSMAQFSQVGSSAAMGANDYIDWSQFGAEGTGVASGATGVTAGGRGFTIYSQDSFGNDDGGSFTLYLAGSSWFGNYAPGEWVLHHINSGMTGSTMAIIMDSAVNGIGAQVHTNRYGAFTATAGFWNTYPGFANGGAIVSGVSDGSLANPDVYLGGSDNANLIKEFYFRAYMDDGTTDDLGYGVGRVDVKVVPEPASIAALALGGLGLIRRRRK